MTLEGTMRPLQRGSVPGMSSFNRGRRLDTDQRWRVKLYQVLEGLKGWTAINIGEYSLLEVDIEI